MSNHSRRRALPLYLSLVLLFPTLVLGSAAAGDEPAGPPLTAGTRAAAIDGVMKRLRDGYVFSDIARKMEQDVQEHAAKGAYDGITRGADLARILSAHLREVSKDTHILVSYSPEKRPKRPAAKSTAEEQAKRKKQAAAANFGFKRVERLAGNVGYLELDGFWRPAEAAEAAAAAMTFLTNTEALIIDLRSNGGGNPGTVALLSSYFLGEEPVHLWDEHSRPGAVTCPVWSLPHVTGKRYLGKDVFLLTSRGTYSAAEGFAYTLKNLKRATIIGEATGGGAHPGDTQLVDEHFTVFVPTGRVVSPVTKTDWEGSGVKPDVQVPAQLALATAHIEALKRLAARQTDDAEAARLKKIRQGVEQELIELKAKGTK